MRVRHTRLLLALTLVLAAASNSIAQNLPDRSQLITALRRAAQDRDNPKLLQIQKLIVQSDEIRYGPNHPKVAEQLVLLANLFRIADDYSQSETTYKRAIEIYENNPPPDILDLALAYRGITNLYSQSLGRYADAEQILRRNQAMLEKAFGPRHQHTATALSDLGTLYYTQKRYADAQPLYERALAIDESARRSDSASLSTSLHNLALVYWKQYRIDDAERMFKRSLALRSVRGKQPVTTDHISTLQEFATFYMEQRRYREAGELLNQSLTLSENWRSNGRATLIALAHYYIGELYLAAGRPDLAEQFFARAKADADTWAPGGFIQANSQYYIGKAQSASNKFAEAEQSYQNTFAQFEKLFGPNHSNVADVRNDLATLYLKQNRVSEALPLVQQSLASNRVNPAIALPVLSDAARQNLLPAQAAFDLALDVVQRSSQNSAAAAVNSLAVRLAAGTDRLAELVRKDQDLNAEAIALDKQSVSALSQDASSRNRSEEQRITHRIAAVGIERKALAARLSSEFPDYAALSNPASVSVKDIQPLLSADEALVIIAPTGESGSFVFVITHDKADWHPIPVGSTSLERKVAAFRRALDVDRADEAMKSGNAAGMFDLGLAHELYDTLLGPVDGLIRDRKRLLIVSSGALTALPFHLLVTDKPATATPLDTAAYREAQWLLKRQSTTVLPSVASLKTLRTNTRQAQASKPMTGFGDPVFDPNTSAGETRKAARLAARSLSRSAFTDFWKGAGVDREKIAQALPQLPDTAEELKAVARTLGVPDSDIHLGSEASEPIVKKTKLDDYRIVYFATHGLVAGDVKQLAEPSLALSIPKLPTQDNDGLLTASEIAQLKLNSDWVVLSACNTIAGDKPGAEALSGLARAFFYAGARALLVSHWAVDSAAATRLTTTTFDKIRGNPRLGRSEALRLAMLDYMNDRSEPRNAHPALWAPFVVVGDGDAR